MNELADIGYQACAVGCHDSIGSTRRFRPGYQKADIVGAGMWDEDHQYWRTGLPRSIVGGGVASTVSNDAEFAKVVSFAGAALLGAVAGFAIGRLIKR